MTAIPKRKLPLIPVLMGLFFLLFVGASVGLLIQADKASALLAVSVVGMALVGIITTRSLLLRAGDAEMALAEGERYIEAVADLSHDVHAIVDTRTRSFLYLNPAVETLLGYPAEAFFKGGLDFFQTLAHPEDLPSLRKQYGRLLKPLEHTLKPGETEVVQEHTFRIRDSHGAYRWFRSRRNVFVRYPDGSPAEFLVVAQDVTEQRSYEAALVQAQKMESLGALTRGTVHDLNNTLMSIQGFADLAQDSAEDPRLFQSHLAKVQESIQRASALCRQMLAYTGPGRIQMAPHQVNEVVKDSQAVIENLVPQGSTLLLDLDNDLPLANVDVNQVRYALMNLVYNAAESLGAQGGEISIHSYVKHLEEDTLAGSGLEGDCVCLEVRDTGATKPPEMLEKICDPIFATLYPGFGLGLSAVQGILKEHQGRLQVNNLPGAGSATLLCFPLAQKALPVTQGEEGAPLKGVSGVVLLVDDEPSIRTILRKGLESAGFEVLEAEDGVEGFGAFVRHRSSITVVLLDLTMPRMGGDEVFEEIHKLAPEVPIILMSGYSEQDATSALSNKDLAGFLSKPCSIKEALAVVNEALARANTLKLPEA